MARIERLDHADGVQWVELHRRPSHGQIKEIERHTRTAARGDTPGMGGEEAAIRVLANAWHILDADGAPVPFGTAAVDRIPADTWLWIAEECDAILNSIRPADAIVGVLRALRSLRDAVPSEYHDRLAAMGDVVAEMAGSSRPNPETQAAA